jgi:adenosine kinase
MTLEARLATLPMAALFLATCLGSIDSQAWLDRLAFLGLDHGAVRVVDGERGPHAYILTDSANNQITAFQSGALRHSAPLPEAGFDFALLAPDSASSTVHAVDQLTARSTAYILDPGQGLPSLLEGQADADFSRMLKGAQGLFVNDYEAELCSRALGISFDDIARSIPFCVRTLGSKGCELWIGGHAARAMPVATPEKVDDPTGCGDAFRSGFLHGLCRGWPLELCAQLGSVMGSFAIEQAGGQNHKPSMHQIKERFEREFGSFPSPRSPKA